MTAMKMRHELTYDAPVEDVHAMLTDPAFREKVCVAMHTLRHAVTVRPDGDGVWVVVIDQTQKARHIPSFAKRFVGDEIQIVQTETWDRTDRADLALTIPGKPGHMNGDITLNAMGARTTQVVSGDIKVQLPLIGGKLEGLVSELLGAALRAEERVGRAWLAGDR